jgi:predicted NBD/HSP70 family sugar kinase
VKSFGEILDRAEAGEAIVIEVLDEAAEVLGSAIASLINIFNPAMLVLGGDVARATRFIEPGITRTLRRLAHPSMYAQSRLRFSENWAVKPYLGGIALALEGVTSLDSRRVVP